MIDLVLRTGSGPTKHPFPMLQPVPAACTRLLRARLPDATGWFHVGGALVGKGRPDVARLDRLPLMPNFAWERHPCLRIDGQSYRSCIYVKLPVLVVECKEGGALGLSFPPFVESASGRVPTWFGLEAEDGGLRFDLVVPHRWTALHMRPRDFHVWLPRPPEPHEHSSPPGPWRAGSVQTFAGRSVEEVIERAASSLLPDIAAQDPQPESDRALRFLAGVQDPRTGAFVEWKRREARGFLRGFFALPTYNRLAGTLTRAARDAPGLDLVARCARACLLHPDAVFRQPGGLVYHNTLTRTKSGRPRYSTHLGSGVAGYPGGQANAVIALAEVLSNGFHEPRALDRLRGAVDWMVDVRGPDGRFPRGLELQVEPDETGLALGPGTRSDGGDAEGALALFQAAPVLGDPGLTDVALALLRNVEDAFSSRGHLRGYLRDNREEEPDCVSHVGAMRAHMAASAVSSDGGHLRAALRHAAHLVLWIRPGDYCSLDTLVSSFGPRLAPCESLWAARALLDLYQQTGHRPLLRAERACADVLRAERGHPGWTEAVYYDAGGGLHSHSFECAYTAEAVLEWALARGASPRLFEPIPKLHRQFFWSPIDRLRSRIRRTE